MSPSLQLSPWYRQARLSTCTSALCCIWPNISRQHRQAALVHSTPGWWMFAQQQAQAEKTNYLCTSVSAHTVSTSEDPRCLRSLPLIFQNALLWVKWLSRFLYACCQPWSYSVGMNLLDLTSVGRRPVATAGGLYPALDPPSIFQGLDNTRFTSVQKNPQNLF